MKAWVLNKVGDIQLNEVKMPVPADDEVLIKVRAAGICGSDIPRIYETGAHKMPLIPGHEFSGEVDSSGKDVPKEWLGKRVAIFPKIPCGKCTMCQKGQPDLCTQYDYVGSRRDGAFAEYVTAPCRNLLELPDSVSFEEAAMLEPLAVAANAVRTGCADKPKDSSIAVCGAGTIGLMVIMLLKEAGFNNIYVIGNKDFQKDKALSLGIPSESFIDIRKSDPVSRLKESAEGIEIYFECVGSNDSISYGLNTLNPRGRLVLVGNPRSDMFFSRDTYWNILRRQLELKGIWNSTFGGESDDWGYVLNRLSEGTFKPSELISHRLPMEELESGFMIMKNKTEDYIKVMLVNDR